MQEHLVRHSRSLFSAFAFQYSASHVDILRGGYSWTLVSLSQSYRSCNAPVCAIDENWGVMGLGVSDTEWTGNLVHF
jgi:hypothetical protein